MAPRRKPTIRETLERRSIENQSLPTNVRPTPNPTPLRPSGGTTLEEPKPKTPRVFTDVDTGEVTGVEIPGGRTLLGLKPEEVDNIVQNFNRKRRIPEGAVSAVEEGRKKRVVKEAEQAITGLGQEVAPTETIREAIGEFNPENLLKVGSSAVGGSLAVGGAGAGVAGALGLGALTVGAPLAIGAGVLGGFIALKSIINSDRKQVTTNAFEVYGRATNGYTQLLNDANRGLIPPSELVQEYNKNLANAREAERILTKLTTSKAGLSGYRKAEDELAEVREWLKEEPRRRLLFEQALLNPNPNVNYPVIPTRQGLEERGALEFP